MTREGEDACFGGGAVRLPCGHLFGRKCISDVFEAVTEDNKCPMCRRLFKFTRLRRLDDITMDAQRDIVFESFTQSAKVDWKLAMIRKAMLSILLRLVSSSGSHHGSGRCSNDPRPRVVQTNRADDLPLLARLILFIRGGGSYGQDYLVVFNS